MNFNKQKCITAVILLLVAILSITVIGKYASAPENHQKTIASLDEKKQTVMELTAASTVTSALITLLPGDTATPIAEKMAESEISHSEIETEFDSMLMRKKGLDPHTRNAALHLVVNKNCAQIIAPFFDLKPKQILKAVSSMKRYHQLLLVPKKPKRLLIDTALKISGNYDTMHGMMVNEEPNPHCVDSNWELFRRLKNAVEPCEELIEEYLDVCNGTQTLNERFSRNYE